MKGSCLCGNVTFEVTGEVLRTSACHCTMCRKQSGHVWASGSVRPDDISIHGDVRWFRASEKAERGFCPSCGSLEDTLIYEVQHLRRKGDRQAEDTAGQCGPCFEQ